MNITMFAQNVICVFFTHNSKTFHVERCTPTKIGTDKVYIRSHIEISTQGRISRS